jgi:predicted RNA-binding protein with PIN domain
VMLVFDAYQTARQRQEHVQFGVYVVYTDVHETADERIERMVYELRDTYRQITVATSDYVEQQVTFGGGALRISAEELLRRLEQGKHHIRQRLQQVPVDTKPRVLERIRHDVANILEKWRRE